MPSVQADVIIQSFCLAEWQDDIDLKLLGEGEVLAVSELPLIIPLLQIQQIL